MTEASLNLADSAELLALMARAGFKRVFVGIETPDVESLIECGKVQNTRLTAFLRSFWVIGVWNRGRRAFWKYFMQVLLRHRQALSEAVHLAIWGVHFRKAAEQI